VVTWLDTGSNVRGFRPGGREGFLRAIKDNSSRSFGGEVKQENPSRNIFKQL
jgi:hypothetical protein